MRAEDILIWNRAVPFVPYRIRMNSGRTFDVRHPEMIRVTRTTAFLFTFTGEPTDPSERVEMIGLLLIESVEPIPASAAA
jgi:hypothetical protein